MHTTVGVREREKEREREHNRLSVDFLNNSYFIDGSKVTFFFLLIFRHRRKKGQLNIEQIDSTIV